ncbi:protein KIBRA [Crotalus adamanteus]|uniref:Protein KIBRA n=1 Tax=Crotalus adamanteus TaxID=8729 RepID=A0AAW1C943_CROAD
MRRFSLLSAWLRMRDSRLVGCLAPVSLFAVIPRPSPLCQLLGWSVSLLLRLLPGKMPRQELPLPEGWEEARDYIDHATKTTSWVDPRDSLLISIFELLFLAETAAAAVTARRARKPKTAV